MEVSIKEKSPYRDKKCPQYNIFSKDSSTEIQLAFF